MAGESSGVGDRSGPEQSQHEGLSALAAAVLGQLAISSWLPGAFLVISLIAIVTFRGQSSLDVVGALSLLSGTENQIMFLVWAIPVLVIATMITQAFAFETIRALEGYWWHRGPVGSFRRWKVKRQVGRRRRVQTERVKLSSRIFAESRAEWLARGTSHAVVDAMENLATDLGIEAFPPDVQAQARKRKWWSLCDPSDVSRVEDLREIEREYPPREARTMPTRLGNVLRSAEDRLRNTNGDLAGFVLRNRAMVSARVQQQHDQYRARLDMYCTLSLVCVLYALAYPVALLAFNSIAQPLGVAAVSAGYACLAFVSYRAAVAAARAYAVTLRQIDRASGKTPES